MTFEEIHDAIVSGMPAASFEEAEKSLDILVRYGGKTEVMIALRITEASKLYPDKNFWKWASEKFPFKGEKTVYHLYSVGRMLIGLRDFRAEDPDRDEKSARTLETTARRVFAQCLETEIGKLLAIVPICNAYSKSKKEDESKEQAYRRGLVEVMNFFRNHYNPEWTCEELRAERDKLYGFGKKKKKDDDRQLTLQFDFLDEIAPETLANLVNSDKFDTNSAMTLAYNGALMCRNANEFLAAHANEFQDEELEPFEELLAELEAAKQQLSSMLSARKRKALGLLQ